MSLPLRDVAACITALLTHWAAVAVLPSPPLPVAPAAPVHELVWLESPPALTLASSPAAAPAPARAPRPKRVRPVALAHAAPPQAPVVSAQSEEASLPGVTDGAVPGGSLDAAGLGNASSDGAGQGVAMPARDPRLVAVPHPCAGYFPVQARVNHGEVQISVDVDAEGHALARDILLEHPVAQGFASSARSCARALRFTPALDAHGVATPGRARLRLRFDRTAPAHSASRQTACEVRRGQPCART